MGMHVHDVGGWKEFYRGGRKEGRKISGVDHHLA